jgi:hypothetical protein
VAVNSGGDVLKYALLIQDDNSSGALLTSAGDMKPQLILVQRSYVPVVEMDVSFLRFVHLLKEVGNCGFSRTLRGTDNEGRLAGGKKSRNVEEGGNCETRSIGEGDVVHRKSVRIFGRSDPSWRNRDGAKEICTSLRSDEFEESGHGKFPFG